MTRYTLSLLSKTRAVEIWASSCQSLRIWCDNCDQCSGSQFRVTLRAWRYIRLSDHMKTTDFHGIAKFWVWNLDDCSYCVVPLCLFGSAHARGIYMEPPTSEMLSVTCFDDDLETRSARPENRLRSFNALSSSKLVEVLWSPGTCRPCGPAPRPACIAECITISSDTPHILQFCSPQCL